MAQAVLGFNEQLERIGEVVVVILLGGDALAAVSFTWEAVGFVALLLLRHSAGRRRHRAGRRRPLGATSGA